MTVNLLSDEEYENDRRFCTNFGVLKEKNSEFVANNMRSPIQISY